MQVGSPSVSKVNPKRKRKQLWMKPKLNESRNHPDSISCNFLLLMQVPCTEIGKKSSSFITSLEHFRPQNNFGNLLTRITATVLGCHEPITADTRSMLCSDHPDIGGMGQRGAFLNNELERSALSFITSHMPLQSGTTGRVLAKGKWYWAHTRRLVQCCSEDTPAGLSCCSLVCCGQRDEGIRYPGNTQLF